jgi:uncharacterized lipoprotein YehR (DUF1307 family)
MIKSLIVSSVLIVSLSACTPMSALKFLNPFDRSSGISVDAQVGKENTQQNAGIAITGDKGDISDSNVSKSSTGVVLGQVTENKVLTDKIDTSIIAEQQTNIKAEQVSNVFNNIPPWVLILLILGWVLPTPTSMFHSLVEWRRDRKRQARLDECNKRNI